MENKDRGPFRSILFAAGMSLLSCTQPAAKSGHEEKVSVPKAELGSFNVFSEQALREIFKERRGNVFQGYVSVSKGVNIRTEPSIESRFNSPNTIRWEDIDSLNGVSLAGVDSFIVVNPLIVEGQDPSGVSNMSKKAPWLAFEAQIKGLLGGKGGKAIVYISFSEQTLEHVQWIGPDTSLNITNQPNLIGAIIPKEK